MTNVNELFDQALYKLANTQRKRPDNRNGNGKKLGISWMHAVAQLYKDIKKKEGFNKRGKPLQ